MTRLWIAALLLALGLAAGARADERILDFHSEISILADGGMLVDETIRVRGEGDRIRHGIYRDFPTDYKDRFGNRVHVDFLPLTLTRDGASEPFHTESQGNGVRVYFGAKDVTLAPGEYTYVLGYKTTRQLGFFDDHDELYWNVTGNGWDFTIDAASAAVTLPDAIEPGRLHAEAYTGAQGANGRDWLASIDAPSHASYRTTRRLAANEGLTIVLTFPKGIIAAPTSAQRTRWFLSDNAAVLAGAIGLLLVWAYYLWQWLRVGRDPKPGVIIPEYEPPAGFSPGTLRYLERMKYDDRCFAADVVDLAVRGALTLRQEGSEFSMKRAGNPVAAPDVEVGLRDRAFGADDELVFRQSEHARIAAVRNQHKETVIGRNAGRYFNTNSVLVVPGALLGVVALVIAVFGSDSTPFAAGAGFMLVWLSGWTVGVVALLANVRAAWKKPAGIATSAAALFATLFALPFLAGEVIGIGAFFLIAGVGFGLVVVALVATNIAFFQWLKAPTVEGRKLLDRIAGLRLYIGVAERDEIARQRDAPPMTVEEFQKFLPYALALDIEKTWADRFAAVVGPVAAAAAVGAMAWYRGSGNFGDLSSVSSGLGASFSDAISSSSTAPGSSSGGGGGGSSGGGGGGGGGGGW